MKLAVLVATKDRGKALSVLIQDLLNSFSRPDQLVIVGSGDQLDYDFLKSINEINISFQYLEKGGQIAQKRAGIDLVNDDIDWVIFLDDDVRISKNLFLTFKNEVENIERQGVSNLAGIGFALPPTHKLAPSSLALNFLGRIFLLASKNRGKVLKSGHPVNYLDSEVNISTEWLNGISAWRKHALKYYQSSFQHVSYASMEDVFFSYRVSRSNKLLFIPSLEVNFQNEYITNYHSVKNFSLTSFWTYIFVRQFREFSLGWYLYSQVGRSAYFLCFGDRQENFQMRVKAVLRTNFIIFKCLFLRDYLVKYVQEIEALI